MCGRVTLKKRMMIGQSFNRSQDLSYLQTMHYRRTCMTQRSFAHLINYILCNVGIGTDKTSIDLGRHIISKVLNPTTSAVPKA